MDKTLYILVTILIGVVVGIVFGELFPLLLKFTKRLYISISNGTDKKKDSLEHSFLTNPTPGKYFVKMIYTGQMGSVKTGNHGSTFPDDRLLKTFEIYGSEDICVALDAIGDGI